MKTVITVILLVFIASAKTITMHASAPEYDTAPVIVVSGTDTTGVSIVCRNGTLSGTEYTTEKFSLVAFLHNLTF